MLKRIILGLIVIGSLNVQAREITCECKNGEILFANAYGSKIKATCHLGCSSRGGVEEISRGYNF